MNWELSVSAYQLTVKEKMLEKCESIGSRILTRVTWLCVLQAAYNKPYNFLCEYACLEYLTFKFSLFLKIYI